VQYIDIIIPTRNRLKKLMRCLSSIPNSAEDIDIMVQVVCDGDRETFEAVRHLPNVQAVLIEDHKGSVYCRNYATKISTDAVLPFCDDMTFEPGAISEAIRVMREKFPDDDGVVGFVQNGVNGTGNPAVVALVGQTFLRRFPDRRLFYPGYWLFACDELYRAAAKLGKFYRAEQANTFHFHPGFHPGQLDTTHAEGRAFIQRDQDLKARRIREGRIWGIGEEAAQERPTHYPAPLGDKAGGERSSILSDPGRSSAISGGNP
jgi:glycosyltransferase involved in cell wall biosynthesis